MTNELTDGVDPRVTRFPATPPDRRIPPHPKDKYLTQQKIIARGWTRTLVRRFLGEPDQRVPKRGFIHLYDVRRVLDTEKLPEFQEAKEKAARRSQTGKQVAQRKAFALLQQVEAMQITVRQIGGVQDAAIDSYNAWKEVTAWDDRGEYRDWKPATPDSEKRFLQRITINFIRHELTEYDTRLEEVAAQTGAIQARGRIRVRVLDAIAEAYPDLATECQAQQYRSVYYD